MSLRALLRSSVAAACIASVAAPSVYAAGPVAASRGALDVRVAQAAEFSRLEFHWTGGAKLTSKRDGQVLTLRFNRDANPDTAALRLAPPRWVKAIDVRHAGGALEVVLTLTDDADARLGQADGSDFVNIFARAGASQTPSQQAAAAPPVGRPNPMPAGGVVRVGYEKADSQAKLTFDWAAPAGAAVFRRGEAVWVVFDTPARLDISKLPAATPRYTKIQAFKGADYSALRIVTPAGQPYAAEGQGGQWSVSLGAGLDATPDAIKVARDESVSPATLTAVLAGVTMRSGSMIRPSATACSSRRRSRRPRACRRAANMSRWPCCRRRRAWRRRPMPAT
jgi:hypothetical protein